MHYGLIGARLAHSHSPAIHKLLAPYAYDLYEMPQEDIAAFIRRPDIGGLNVTIPYKQVVMPLCDELSPQARRIDSVNTLVYGDDRRIIGHNTDYSGFSRMALEAGIAFSGRKVVILGSGGTAQTAIHVAKDEGAKEVVVVSRTGEDNYGNLPKHADAEILINTTPVGMYPAVEAAPVSLDMFPNLVGVVDVIYNPLRTTLVQDALRRGIPTANGLAMLVYQAAFAAELFLKEAIPPERVANALKSIRASVENIVLIGMPGCGKSSVGRVLAEMTGRPLVDTDREIVMRAGKPVADIFAKDGEAVFRAMESAVIAENAKRSGIILATGGGSVLSGQNRAALSQNGRIVYLRRAIHMLATRGRPLSANLQKLAQERLPLYTAVSDIIVDNRGYIRDVAQKIWEAFA